jgi:mannitol/fructose-specific phosphotransferase system IIA component (Ntr-type)
VLLVPSQATQDHLNLLAGAVELLSKESTRVAIRQAAQPSALSEIAAMGGLV